MNLHRFFLKNLWVETKRSNSKPRHIGLFSGLMYGLGIDAPQSEIITKLPKYLRKNMCLTSMSATKLGTKWYPAKATKMRKKGSEMVQPGSSILAVNQNIKTAHFRLRQ